MKCYFFSQGLRFSSRNEQSLNSIITAREVLVSIVIIIGGLDGGVAAVMTAANRHGIGS